MPSISYIFSISLLNCKAYADCYNVSPFRTFVAYTTKVLIGFRSNKKLLPLKNLDSMLSSLSSPTNVNNIALLHVGFYEDKAYISVVLFARFTS